MTRAERLAIASRLTLIATRPVSYGFRTTRKPYLLLM
jgi:hypothetical protein